MAWPLEVIDIAAEFADLVGRGVHQAHVANHQLTDAVVLKAAVKARYRAADALVGFTFGDQRLDTCLHCLMAITPAHVGSEALEHTVGDVFEFFGDVNDEVRAARQFVAASLGKEAVRDQIVVGGRVALDGVIGAVMIGDHQALRRHERRRAGAG